ncbi:MAG: type II toxin-antitoxin system death-on-curing family toxin [Coriobacteriia bacterium]
MRWVDRIVVEAVHLDLVRAHGGLPGLRDEHALESAIARPRQHFAYKPGCDEADLAAAYGFALARSHPFNDGNKRIAFVVMGVFLGLNGFEIEAPEAEVVTVMLDLAAGEISEEQLAGWLRTRLVR